MKHPALTRIFSVVLAMMCLIMILSGIKGYGDTTKQYEDNVAYADSLQARIEKYREVESELSNSISYEDAFAELEKVQTQHDTDASQHKTDLATYSATKGGYELAVQTINDAKAQLAAARAQLEAGKAQLNAAEAALPETVAGLNAFAPGCTAAAGGCSSVASQISATVAALPAKPAAPTPVEEPAEDDVDYATKKPLYDAYVADKATYDTVTLPAWDGACQAAASAIVGGTSSALPGFNQAMVGGNDLLGKIMPLLPDSVQGSMQTAAMGPVPLSAPAISADMTGDEVIAALGSFQSDLTAASGFLNALSSDMSGVAAALPGAIASAKSNLAFGENELKKGEQAIQGNLENIWYHLGELEKDEKELSEEQIKLLDEAGELNKKLATAEELKELEKERRSTTALLKNVDEIKAMVDDGGDLAESSETYLASFRADSAREYKGRLVICVLALLCGLFGIAGIPAAFEKIKKRFWLIAPVVACLGCAVGAYGINIWLGLGQMYAALFTGIFALIQLAVVIPKVKKNP